MAFLTCNFYSDALKHSTDVNVIIPSPSDLDKKTGSDYFQRGKKFQVLYLLHGTYGDYADWTRLSSIERYAQEARLAVVVPSGFNSFWQDLIYGPKYFKYVTEELPKFMRILFPISDRREDKFVAGLSMGGYGALNIGIRRSDLFSGVIALSSGLDVAKDTDIISNGNYPWQVMLPSPYDGIDSVIDDIPILTQKVENKIEMPRFYMACGTEDAILPRAKRAKEFLQNQPIDFTYEEGPGEHNYYFWDLYIQRAIAWMNLKKTTI